MGATTNNANEMISKLENTQSTAKESKDLPLVNPHKTMGHNKQWQRDDFKTIEKTQNTLKQNKDLILNPTNNGINNKQCQRDDFKTRKYTKYKGLTLNPTNNRSNNT